MDYNVTGGFAKGFADGFIRSKERSEDRQAEQENVMFKYKMDALMEQKSKRAMRKQQEDEWARQAKDLATQMGDPEFASTAMNELRNKVDYETLQKRMAEGAYAKNDAYKAPVTTIKVPSAVAQPVNTNPSAGAPNTLASDEMNMAAPAPMSRGQEMLSKVPGLGGLIEGKRQRDADKANRNVNERIDAIDPSLRQTPMDDDGTTSTADATNSKYLYKPKNELKIGDYADALYKLETAQQSKDPIAIGQAQREVKAHEMVLTRKAAIEAAAKGENVKTYVVKDKDGKLGKQFAGVVRDGALWDVSDPRNPNGSEVLGDFVAMGEEDMKRWNTLSDNFGKAASDYNNIAAPAYIAALDSANKMDQLLTADPGAATYAYKGAGLLQRLSGEAQAAMGLLQSTEMEIQSKAASGDMEGMEAMIAKHADAVNKTVTEMGKMQGVDRAAMNAGLYNSLKLSAAYQFAMAKSGGEKMSNQDFNNEVSRITGDGMENPDVVKAALRVSAQEGFLKLNSMQNALNKDPSINAFETRMGVKTGLKADRIGDMIMSLDRDDQTKASLMGYLRTFGADAAVGKMQANEALLREGQKAPSVMDQPAPPVQPKRAVNKKTGEVLELRNGKWEKVQ